jgi:sigma-B regulation protein RsbU (phosphoserine phosphatase)
VAGWCKPARSVAGDFYDFIELPDDRVAVFIGDVSGKGPAAAEVKRDICTRLRALTFRGIQPAELVTRLNEDIYGRSRERFVTLLYMILDRRTHEVEAVCAGHFPALIRRSDGSVVDLPVDGSLPVGVLPETRYRPIGTGLAPEDVLCLYTDGIVEAMDEEQNQFGRHNLAAALRESAARPATLLRSVRQRLERHVGRAPQHDDATLLCVGSDRDAWCEPAA